MSKLRRESGQAMVEFGLTAVVFFTTLLFTVDASRILWNYVSVAEAARIGARYAIVHGAKSTAPVGPGSYTALTQQVQTQMTGLAPANMTVTPTWNPNNSPGSSVTVAISYRTSPVTGIFWRGQTLTLTGQSTMVIQN